MISLHTVDEVRALTGSWKQKGYRIALVPTMGALHKGHLSLISVALEQADKCLVSIFVNPTQFGPNEDLDSYPRTVADDLDACREAGVAAVFLPENKEIYPEGFCTTINQTGLPDHLCGASRPGHFRGVMTVVTKLFNIVLPDLAVFGQKDYQQVAVIKQMVKDLNIPVQIVTAPIIREDDGLAMSSRNMNLKPDHRTRATVLYRSLLLAAQSAQKGTPPERIINEIETLISSVPDAVIDYIEIRHPLTLLPVTDFQNGAVVALAVKFGNVRLIDNWLIQPC